MDKFIVIDGPAVIHRAWHALPKLTDPRGRSVSAVYGFISLLLKLIREQQPKYIAVAFDTKALTFRHEAYKEYKEGRVKQPQEFYDQFAIIKELLNAFGIKFVEQPGFEADDLIGTLVDKSDKENLIVTGDLDTLQLVNSQTKVYFLHKGISDIKIYDQEAIEQRYGLTPRQLIDFKAMRGDPSDNIGGIKGIGEKTALVLLQKFGSLEKIYEYLETCQKDCEIRDSVKDLLIEQKDKAFFDKNLVTIKKDMAGYEDLEQYNLEPMNKEKITEVLSQLGFSSLIKRLDSPPKAVKKTKETPSSRQSSLFDK
ncbi:MAG: 5'-3' exonuclease H3TH domain-containing protein [Patescibacteria group bacterium]|nr:5'-3' exonuclease H3TH domain-containing protein [Patescibacteria group bacterium]MDD5121211.1 5'-3' exonuclease H3TH domain-containing protein [Patescibacteria group bacterium]MDD5221760.1 5'-3' exonuclease H3TH domain-containing protein [Patescibacteria group bacterium]MDD5395870.1 5'-3' exonuclease H3TH domain-containing protein [Patescibacteria group bacterium]